MVSQLGSSAPLIVEKAGFLVGSLDAPLFLPVVFTFETNVPVDIAQMIDTNPYGKIQFQWLGNTYEMFILEVGIKPADNAVYTWKGLATAQTDISKLIHG
jgi:hypothetical protein